MFHVALSLNGIALTQDLDSLEAKREEKEQRQELIKENCLEKTDNAHIRKLL